MTELRKLQALISDRLPWKTILFLVSSFVLGLNIYDTVEFIAEKSSGPKAYLLHADQTLINTMIVVMAVMLFLRQFPLYLLPLMLLAGELVYDKMVFIGGLHSFLNEFDLYRNLFGRHANKVVNPQYGMLAAYAVVFIALFCTIWIKRTRTFDRFMTVFVSTSVMGTFILFHTLLIFDVNDAISNETRVVRSVFSDGAGSFARQCEAVKVNCFIVDRKEPTRDRETGMEIDPNIARTLKDIAERSIQLNSIYSWSETTLEHGATTFWVAAIATSEKSIYLAVSGDDFDRAVAVAELQFEALSVSAHGTWFLMLIAIMAIHRKHSRKSIRKLLPPDAFG